MNLTGNILKETARISHQLLSKRKPSNKEQAQVLSYLLSKAKKTKFGKTYKFDTILSNPALEKAFSQTIPLFTYERFNQAYLKDAREDVKNVIWPGKIGFYALSSGTTEDTSKKIPVSESMIKQFQKTTFEQLSNLYELELDNAFFSSSVLTIGGSTQLTKVNQHFEGDLSGILQKHKSILFKPYTKPSKTIARLKDWNEKMERIVIDAPKWNIGVIAGVPTWVSMLLEKIVAYHKLKTIHDIWPNFKLYLHGGVFLDNYQQKIDELCASPIHYLNTYLASEGYFAYQKANTNQDMTLLLKHGIYYEFIEEKYFDLVNAGKFEDIPTKTISQISKNERYGLVISTCSGLWRYIIGDVVRFTDIENYRLIIEGRISQTLTTAGEHLSLNNITQAMEKTAEELNIPVQEFCVYPSKNHKRHLWYVGSHKVINENLFAVTLNKHLEILNDDYKHVRKYYLKAPKVKALPIQKFYEFLDIKNKLGGQHKFARVLNDQQKQEWEVYLNSTSF